MRKIMPSTQGRPLARGCCRGHPCQCLLLASSWRIIAPLVASSRCATGAEAGGGGDHRIGGKYRTAACEACSTLSPRRGSILREGRWRHGAQTAKRSVVCLRRWLLSAFFSIILITHGCF